MSACAKSWLTQPPSTCTPGFFEVRRSKPLQTLLCAEEFSKLTAAASPAGYKTNSWFLNHCITAFLKRVASPDGLNLEPMLYQVCALRARASFKPSSALDLGFESGCCVLQVSVLRVFEQILSDADFRRTPCSAQLVNFCTGLVQNLFTRLLPSKKGGQQAERSGAPTVRSAQAALDKAQNGVLPEIRSGGAGGQEGEREVMSSAEVPPEREAEVQRNLTRMMFVELLLWKNQGESEEVRDEYHWRVRDVLPKTLAAVLLLSSVSAGALLDGIHVPSSTQVPLHCLEAGRGDFVACTCSTSTGEGLWERRKPTALEAPSAPLGPP